MIYPDPNLNRPDGLELAAVVDIHDPDALEAAGRGRTDEHAARMRKLRAKGAWIVQAIRADNATVELQGPDGERETLPLGDVVRHDADSQHVRRARLSEALDGGADAVEAFAPPLGRYLTVTQHDDDDKHFALYDTLEAALEGAAEEVLGDRWPVAIFDLDTGKSLPHGVKVIVFVSDDDGARVYGDLDG